MKEANMMERPRHLKIVSRGNELPENGRTRIRPGPSISEEPWKIWASRMWSEVARVHTLMDQVSSGMPELILDPSADSDHSHPRDAELRTLQAYYRGLRFAIDCHSDVASRY
jgi:hypothetical protein